MRVDAGEFENNGVLPLEEPEYADIEGGRGWMMMSFAKKARGSVREE